MKKIKNLVIGGIQNKIFNLVLFAIVLIVAVYTAVFLWQYKALRTLVEETNADQKESITRLSDSTMHSVIENSLVSGTKMRTEFADNLFQELRGNVMMTAEYAGTLFADPDSVPAAEAFRPDPDLDGRVSVQLVTAEGVDIEEPAVARKIGLIANMSGMMSAMCQNARVDSAFIALPEGVMLIADSDSAGKYDKDGKLINIPVTERDWFSGAAKGDRIYFTDVQRDIFTGRIEVVCAVPVFVRGELAAVAGSDLFLDSLQEEVSDSAETGGFACIINQYGHVIFSAQEGGAFKVRLGSEASDLRKSVNESLAAFVSEAMHRQTGVHEVQADGTTYYMCGAPMETLGWAVATGVDKNLTDQPTILMEQNYEEILGRARTTFSEALDWGGKTLLSLLALIGVLTIASALYLAKKIVDPLNAITTRIAGLSGSNLQFFMEDKYKTDDEIQVLAESFASLSAKTVQYLNEVKAVTAEKERINAELGMATAIQASTLPHLFPAYPDRHEFDIYASMTPAKEVGGDFYDFFLVDDDHIALVMADVAGKGVPAALFMMISKILIRNRLQSGDTPGRALENVNRQLMEGNEAEMFVTVWLAIVELSTGKGVATNAGHEHPVLRRAGGRYELVKYRHSPAVAVMDDIPFREHDFQLNPGDSLFVYTDGVAEAANDEDELFGTDRMVEVLNKQPGARPECVLRNVSGGIDNFVLGAEQFDDITMLCFRYNGKDGNGKDKEKEA